MNRATNRFILFVVTMLNAMGASLFISCSVFALTHAAPLPICVIMILASIIALVLCVFGCNELKRL